MRRHKRIKALICACLLAGAAAAQDVPVLDGVPQEEPIGTIDVLHKVTARIRTVHPRINMPVEVGSLTIVMRACVSTPPEEPPETKMFLEVRENREGVVSDLFAGWMFASSPGLSALEHPVYDLWPIACKTSDGAPYTDRG